SQSGSARPDRKSCRRFRRRRDRAVPSTSCRASLRPECEEEGTASRLLSHSTAGGANGGRSFHSDREAGSRARRKTTAPCIREDGTGENGESPARVSGVGPRTVRRRLPLPPHPAPPAPRPTVPKSGGFHSRRRTRRGACLPPPPPPPRPRSVGSVGPTRSP